MSTDKICETGHQLRVGDTVITPEGVGRLFQVEGSKAIVEMDYSYLVEYPLDEVVSYSSRVVE